MGNSVPHIPLRIHQIQLVPGNVLIFVEGNDARRKAQSLSKGDGVDSLHNLFLGHVVGVGPPRSGRGGDYAGQDSFLKIGDQVWVRARKGYPIDTLDGRLFVFNEWDVAIKVGAAPSGSASNGVAAGGGRGRYGGGGGGSFTGSPPPYEEKERFA